MGCNGFFRMLSTLVVATVVTFGTGGCSSGLDTAAAAGTWVSDDGGRMELAPAGTFSAEGLKNEIFDDYQRSGEAHSGSGTWNVVRADQCLDLVFKEVVGLARQSVLPMQMQMPMYCSGSGSGLRIYFIIGDPDDHNFYYFHKSVGG